MPHFASFPVVLDWVPQLKISSLRKWGYFKEESCSDITISWTSDWSFDKQAIRVIVDTRSDDPHIRLIYKNTNSQMETSNMNYRVDLVQLPSNLGKGSIWYFRCPITDLLCRKMFSIGKYFGHREAFPEACYFSQTLSRKGRYLNSQYDKLQRREKGFDIVYGKGFTPYYNGVPTKKYIEVSRWIKEGEGISEADLFMA